VSKATIPQAVRRAVALAAGVQPGETRDVPCRYCGVLGRVTWFRLASGRPSAWVHFEHELEHVVPEALGGATTAENVVLACRPCNRSKGTEDAPRRLQEAS
jgi:5-methylcytosine-specific restriction endonuclease McrA